MLVSKLSGHMYVGSDNEPCNSCGNCDGARCDSCVKKWASSYDRTWFTDKAEAIEWDEALTEEAVGLVGEGNFTGPDLPSDIEYYLNGWGELVASYYDHGYGYQGDGGWVCLDGKGEMEVLCNTEASTFNSTYVEAHKALQRWVRCPCTDKADAPYGNACAIMGCNDPRCWYEVQHKGRIECKWYM